jgi:sec-independent protein translocase protein TatC
MSKIYLFTIFILSVIFFIAGCFFGYFYLFPTTLSFFINLVDQDIEFNPERLNYIFYSFWLIIVSGFIYQLPIISLILTKLRIINYEFLKQMRSVAFLLFLVFGAIISPPDPLSQLLIAFPLYLLYELGIIISYIFRVK